MGYAEKVFRIVAAMQQGWRVGWSQHWPVLGWSTLVLLEKIERRGREQVRQPQPPSFQHHCSTHPLLLLLPLPLCPFHSSLLWWF